MEEFRSELGQDYGSYTFGYAEYAKRVGDESLEPFYAKGYLPYSGSADAEGIFYRARSARIALQSFELSSENRRIAKKFDGRFAREILPLEKLQENESFLAFCLNYFAVFHGERAMPKERLSYILRHGPASSIVAYTEKGSSVAYVLEVTEKSFGHYWFSFYDPSFARQSLGMWLMLDGLREAKAHGLTHYYLGTVYGEKALYKTNFGSLEWWDGEGWSADVLELKERARTDSGRSLSGPDLWKRSLRPFA